MRGLLSLDQELRAVRRGNSSKNANRSSHIPEPNAVEQPWKHDIEQIQQTMREVLRAIAGLSGVELPGLPAGVEDDQAPLPRLDIKTLKDRFRNELEGFSIKTTEELAKRAREQTQAALDAVQNEVMDGRIDHVTSELREKLQSPAQIEKFVEPAVKEAVASLEHSFSQKVEKLFAEQHQLVQDKLQGALGAVQAQVSSQVDAEFREILQLPDHIEKLVEPAVEEAAAGMEKSLSEKVDRLFAEQQRLVQEKLEGALSSVQARVSAQVDAELRVKVQPQAEAVKLVEPRVGEVAAKLETALSQKVDHLFAEQQRLVQGNLQGALGAVETQISTLQKTVQEIREHKAEPVAQVSVGPMATSIEKSLSEKVEQLFAEHENSIQNRLQGTLGSIQAEIGTLEQTVQKMRSDSVAHLSAERSSATVEKSLSAKVENLFSEQEHLVQDKLRDALSPIQAHISTLEQSLQQIRLQQANSLAQLSAERSTATIERTLAEKIEHLFAQHDQLVQTRLQGTLNSVQAQISTLEQTVQKLRADSLTQSAVRASNALDTSTKKDASDLNNVPGGALDQAAKRVESSFNKLLETFKTQSVGPRRQEHRNEVPLDNPAMDSRVQAALDYLDRLGSKSPQPAS